MCGQKDFSSDFQFFFVSSYDIIVKFVFYQCLTMLLLSLFIMAILVRNKNFVASDLFNSFFPACQQLVIIYI